MVTRMLSTVGGRMGCDSVLTAVHRWTLLSMRAESAMMPITAHCY